MLPKELVDAMKLIPMGHKVLLDLVDGSQEEWHYEGIGDLGPHDDPEEADLIIFKRRVYHPAPGVTGITDDFITEAYSCEDIVAVTAKLPCTYSLMMIIKMVDIIGCGREFPYHAAVQMECDQMDELARENNFAVRHIIISQQYREDIIGKLRMDGAESTWDIPWAR
jgi:hypothetical protein